MKKFITEHKNILIILSIIIFLGILYFSYNMAMTWDSSEYLGLADYIGTEEMTEKWIGHRGIAFPLLLKLFKPFGIENKIFMLTLMFVCYISMVIIIYKIYKKLKETELINNKTIKYIFIIYVTIFIILNPMIFGYYHAVLTEFVSMTLAILMCYLTWKWIDLTWKENKKSIVIYAVLFSIITITLYHVKQSLVPIAILPILTAALVSIIRNFKLTNILTKTITILLVVITLISSIKIWNESMKKVDVAGATGKARVNGYIIKGLTKMKEVSDEKTINDGKIDRSLLSSKDNSEIDKVLSNESEYKNFIVYKTSNDKYLVYFTKSGYSNKEDILFYLKVLFNSPSTIAESYYDSYWEIIFHKKNYPIWIGNENYMIPYAIYEYRLNLMEINEEYKEYIKNYLSINETNIVSKTFNIYANKTVGVISAFTKLSLWILPITWLSSIIVYLFINRKVNKNTLKILQFIVILYTTAFGSIMSYVIFAANVDRYTVPLMIPTYIAHFLSIVLLMKIDIKNKKSKRTAI